LLFTPVDLTLDVQQCTDMYLQLVLFH